MNCRECELLVASGDFDAAAAEHLQECVECRVLADELHQNAAAFAAMREADMPVMKPVVPRPKTAVAWVAAAAAAVIAVVVASAVWMRGTEPANSRAWVQMPAAPTIELPAPQTQSTTTERPPHPKALAHKQAPPAEEPLMVKMLTGDPDVVIYWFGDGKEKTE
jgi:hypothetical protein